MKKLILCTVFIFSIPIAWAQETNRTLNLDQVIQLALEQSPDAILAKHKFRSSYWQYRSYKSSMLPSLTLNGDLVGFSSSISEVIQDNGTTKDIYTSNNNSGLGLSINQNVSVTGGRFFINTDLYRRDDFNVDSNGVSYRTIPLSIGYVQPAFQYNAYKWQKKIEPLLYEEAKKKYIYTLEQIAEQAVNNFYNLATAQLNVEIAKTNYHNNDTLYKIAQGRYNMGTIAENELLQLELSYLQSKSSLAQSKINLQISMFQLRSFLGFSELVKIRLNTEKQIPDLKIPLDEAFKMAHQNSSEPITFQRQLYQAEQNVAKAKAENRFNANLYASYGLNQSAYDLQNAYQNPETQQAVSVGIQIPIVDWGEGKGKYKMAKSNQEVVRTQVAQSRIDFEQRIMLKVLQFNEQSNQVYIAAKADTIAQKRYEVAKQRFLIGKIGVLDLNIASSEKDKALRNNLMAKKTYWSYYYNIRQITLYDFLKNEPIEAQFEDLTD